MIPNLNISFIFTISYHRVKPKILFMKKFRRGRPWTRLFYCDGFIYASNLFC